MNKNLSMQLNFSTQRLNACSYIFLRIMKLNFMAIEQMSQITEMQRITSAIQKLLMGLIAS